MCKYYDLMVGGCAFIVNDFQSLIWRDFLLDTIRGQELFLKRLLRVWKIVYTTDIRQMFKYL